MNGFDVKGRIGIITGASGGIGLSIANVLAEAGATVYAFSRTGSVKEGEGSSAKGVIHRMVDVTDYPALEAAVREIGSTGGIDFLINNAGATKKCRAEVFADDDFEWIQRVNVNSVFKLSCLCYPYLKESVFKGRVINISSMSAHLGFSQVVPYCTSKGAVVAMTRGLAVEWAGDNITVNSIAPGWFPSKMFRSVMDEERKQRILSRMPVHEFGETKDVGALALFLISDSAGYITGQDYAIDGGALAYGF